MCFFLLTPLENAESDAQTTRHDLKTDLNEGETKHELQSIFHQERGHSAEQDTRWDDEREDIQAHNSIANENGRLDQSGDEAQDCGGEAEHARRDAAASHSRQDCPLCVHHLGHSFDGSIGIHEYTNPENGDAFSLCESQTNFHQRRIQATKWSNLPRRENWRHGTRFQWPGLACSSPSLSLALHSNPSGPWIPSGTIDQLRMPWGYFSLGRNFVFPIFCPMRASRAGGERKRSISGSQGYATREAS